MSKEQMMGYYPNYKEIKGDGEVRTLMLKEHDGVMVEKVTKIRGCKESKVSIFLTWKDIEQMKKLDELNPYDFMG